MPKQSSKTKRPARDEVQAAYDVVQHVIRQTETTIKPLPEPAPEKNPAAVALGRLGGLKGGRARAEKLSARKRREIAKKAAAARWQKQP
jgi:hypothetical protein